MTTPVSAHDEALSNGAHAYLMERQRAGEVATGLLYIDPDAADMNATLGSVERPLVDLPFEELCPGEAALQSLMDGYR